MPEGALFEVIGGPMDGLGCRLTGPGTAGRKVGNTLSLALDDQVSGRHLECIREGHAWCARDLGSTNGTLLMSQRLDPGRSYPLHDQDVLLLGSTVLLFTEAAEGDQAPAWGGLNFDDPRRRFAMTPELALVWEGLVGSLSDAATPNRLYCDVDRFFLAVMAHIRGQDGAAWACEQWLAAPNRYQILARWLHEVPVERNFQGDPGNLTVAPRLWRLFELAAGEGQKPVDIPAMLAALIQEGRSLAARHIANDNRFSAAYRAASQQGADEAGFLAAFRAAGAATAAPAEPAGTIAPPPAETRPTVSRTLTGGQSDGCEAIWKTFGQRLETLVTGFLADACNPVTGRQEGRPPGLERQLGEVAASPQELGRHLDSLYTLLVAILAGQRDGCKALGEHFLTALEQNAAELKDNRGLGLPLGKKSLDADEWLTRTRTLLGRLESEGASDTLIREMIRKKIQPLGH